MDLSLEVATGVLLKVATGMPPKDITQNCPTKDSIKDVPGKVDIRKMNIST